LRELTALTNLLHLSFFGNVIGVSNACWDGLSVLTSLRWLSASKGHMNEEQRRN
jgi:hypothetical protein